MRQDDKNTRAKRQRRIELVELAICAALTAAALLIGIGRIKGSEDLEALGVILLVVLLAADAVFLRSLSDPEEQTPAASAPQREAPPQPAPAPPAARTATVRSAASAAVPRQLLAVRLLDGRFYQLVPGLEALHFVYLEWGDGFSADAIQRRVTPTWDDAALRAQYRRGFSVPWREIESLEVTVQNSPVMRWHETIGRVVIRTAERTRRLWLVAERDADRDLTPAQLRAFFALAGSALQVDDGAFARQQAEDRAEREGGALRHPLARKLLLPLQWALPAMIGAVMVFLLLFQDFEFVYDGVAWVLIVLGLLPVVLATAMPRIFTVRGLLFPMRGPRAGEPTQCDLSIGLLAGGAALGIVSVGVHIGNAMFLRLAPFFLVLAFVLTVLMMRGVVLRRKLLYSGLIILFTAMLLFGATVELNYLLDTAPARQETAAIVEKRETSSRPPRLQIRIEGQEEWIDVTEYAYDRLNVGDEMQVLVHPGALGIPYTEVSIVLYEEE